MSQQFVRWYPIQDSGERPKTNDSIALHPSQPGLTKPIETHDTILKKNQKEQYEKKELEEKKLRLAQMNAQTKKPENRVPVEQRMREQPPPEINESDQSLLIEQTREILLDFHEMHKKFLKPDYPIRRADRKKYVEEINRFRKSGFMEFVRSIKIKVNALCSFEDVYDKSMFDLDQKTGWFDSKVRETIEQKNFESAQEVINSVMQIVMQDEIVMHKRRIMSKMK